MILPEPQTRTYVQLMNDFAGAQPEQLKLRNLIHTLFGEPESISSFGAIGDGLADDTPAFAEAALTGKLIYLDANKTYRLTERIHFATGGGLIGQRSAVLAPDPETFNNTDQTDHIGPTAALLYATGQLTSPYTALSTIRFQGFTIDCGNIDGRVLYPIKIRNVTSPYVLDIEVKGLALGSGIAVDSCAGGRISGCYVHDFYVNTIWPLLPVMVGIRVDDDLVNAVGSTNIQVVDNHIDGMMVGSTFLAEPNHGWNPDSIGIGGHASNITVARNHISRTGQGVWCFGTGCRILNNDITYTRNHGITLEYGANGCLIAGNTLRYAGLTGISLTAGDNTLGNTTLNEITGNTIINVGNTDWTIIDIDHWASDSTTCLMTWPDSAGFLVTNNYFSDNNLYPGAKGKDSIIRGAGATCTNDWVNNKARLGTASRLYYQFGAETGVFAIAGGGGTYIPTITGVTNIDATTAFSCLWSQNTGIVTVSGRVDVDATTNGVSSEIGISLPVASNFTNALDAAGTVIFSPAGGVSALGVIVADTTNDRAKMLWVAVGTANSSARFTFQYQVL